MNVDIETLKSGKTIFTKRKRFVDAAHCRVVDRAPMWLMRQAGRALPEYRKLKETYSFVQLVQTPELAVEVTLQPVRRFAFDAAILFCDILVIPEAMGQTYKFRETGGIEMDFAVQSAADIAKLSVEHVTERLSYVDKALRILRKELGDDTALNRLQRVAVDAGDIHDGRWQRQGNIRARWRCSMKIARRITRWRKKLTAAVTAYLKMQIAAGVDAVQIFDSHGGHLAPAEFQEASGRWMKQTIRMLGGGAQGTARPTNVPVIAFSLSARMGIGIDLVDTGANIIGIDWETKLADARKVIPEGIGFAREPGTGVVVRCHAGCRR